MQKIKLAVKPWVLQLAEYLYANKKQLLQMNDCGSTLYNVAVEHIPGVSWTACRNLAENGEMSELKGKTVKRIVETILDNCYAADAITVL